MANCILRKKGKGLRYQNLKFWKLFHIIISNFKRKGEGWWSTSLVRFLPCLLNAIEVSLQNNSKGKNPKLISRSCLNFYKTRKNIFTGQQWKVLLQSLGLEFWDIVGEFWFCFHSLFDQLISIVFRLAFGYDCFSRE